jgi:hypothetical protein
VMILFSTGRAATGLSGSLTCQQAGEPIDRIVDGLRRTPWALLAARDECHGLTMTQAGKAGPSVLIRELFEVVTPTRRSSASGV